jgi:predicted transcriptional regulator
MAEENQSKGDQIYSYLRNEVGRDTISNMSEVLNMSRTTLTQYLKKTDTYASHRDGNKVYYAVKARQEEK